MYPHPPGQHGAPPQYSPDGRWWWDGQRWLPAERGPGAPRPGGTGTEVRLLLLGSDAIVALVVIGVAALVLAARPGGRPALVSRPSVVFDDDFSTNRGWDVTPIAGFTTDLHFDHPGAMHMAVSKKEAAFHELYPGTSYARVRFTATIANKTGDGDVGLLCSDPNSRAIPILGRKQRHRFHRFLTRGRDETDDSVADGRRAVGPGGDPHHDRALLL